MPSSFTQIPSELICHTFSQLDSKRDQHSISSSCQRFESLNKRHLYRNITVSQDGAIRRLYTLCRSLHAKPELAGAVRKLRLEISDFKDALRDNGDNNGPEAPLKRCRALTKPAFLAPFERVMDAADRTLGPSMMRSSFRADGLMVLVVSLLASLPRLQTLQIVLPIARQDKKRLLYALKLVTSTCTCTAINSCSSLRSLRKVVVEDTPDGDVVSLDDMASLLMLPALKSFICTNVDFGDSPEMPTQLKPRTCFADELQFLTVNMYPSHMRSLLRACDSLKVFKHEAAKSKKADTRGDLDPWNSFTNPEADVLETLENLTEVSLTNSDEIPSNAPQISSATNFEHLQSLEILRLDTEALLTGQEVVPAAQLSPEDANTAHVNASAPPRQVGPSMPRTLQRLTLVSPSSSKTHEPAQAVEFFLQHLNRTKATTMPPHLSIITLENFRTNWRAALTGNLIPTNLGLRPKGTLAFRTTSQETLPRIYTLACQVGVELEYEVGSGNVLERDDRPFAVGHQGFVSEQGAVVDEMLQRPGEEERRGRTAIAARGCC